MLNPVHYYRKCLFYPFPSWPLIMLGQVSPSSLKKISGRSPNFRVTLRWYKFSEVQFKISISHLFQRSFSKGLFHMQWEISGGEKGVYIYIYIYIVCFFPPLLPHPMWSPWRLLSLSTTNKRNQGSSLLPLGVRVKRSYGHSLETLDAMPDGSFLPL